MAHHRVWLFRPPGGREQEFAHYYGADGEWARLFRVAAGYIGTRLLRGTEPGWWMTIDSWARAEDFERFEEAQRAAYQELDRKLEGVAGEERFVGAFDDY